MNNPLDEHYLSKTNYVSDVESPCVRNCCLDNADICVGCHRTLEEILAWGNASEVEKNQILKRISEQAQHNFSFKNENL